MTEEDVRNNIEFGLDRTGLLSPRDMRFLPRFLTTPTLWPHHDLHVLVPNPLTTAGLSLAVADSIRRHEDKIRRLHQALQSLRLVANLLREDGNDTVLTSIRQAVAKEMRRQDGNP